MNRRFGKIREVRIPCWNDTGRQKGLCYVEYLANQSVKLAVAQSGAVEMGGRKLLIDVESGKPKESFRTPDGNLWENDHKNYENHGTRRNGASAPHKPKRIKTSSLVCNKHSNYTPYTSMSTRTSGTL